MNKFWILTAALVLCLSLAGCKSQDYEEAMALYVDGDYAAACTIFTELGDYEDSEEMVRKSKYAMATEYLNEDNFAQAADVFEELGDYEDSVEKAKECRYQQACELLTAGDLEAAREIFTNLRDYKDSEDRLKNLGWYVFHAYISQVGEIEIDRVTLTAQANTIVATYEYVSKDSDSNTEMTITAEIGTDNEEVLIYGSSEMTVYGASYGSASCADEGEGTWDISTYKSGDSVYWDDYESTGARRNGRLISYMDGLAKRPGSSLKNIASAIAQALEESGLGLTMADIGFTSYEG